ncbi:phage tail sheath family protein [Leptolyngbya sp. AN02str]|uniref:phage tail sheath family protein n=1 Tax=Leptolyngbya sp. AN02str TaxID=3423363 RepID=UPI003D31105D
MPTYLSPGVYVEEVPGGARPIESVGTSTAGFVGVAPDPGAHVHEAVAISSWTQFLREFSSRDRSTSTFLSHAVYGFFLNGGGRCYVVNLGTDETLVGDGRGRKGLAVLEEVDEVAIVAAPGFTDAASHDALISHCEKLRDRVAILDPPQVVGNLDLLKRVATASATRRPPAPAATGEGPAAPPETAPAAVGLRPRQSDGGYGAFYFPWIVVQDPLSPSDRVNVPPSGHLAGIYARVDGTRGVQKAPANELVRGATDLTYQVTHEEQGELNQAGVNCIRYFSTEGIRVWGARTVASTSSEWRYLNVRRLFNMIEESIARSTRWVVFEPNDITLWKAIRRDVNAYLTLLWRQGALMGRTPEQAFFVQCDEETNPQEVIDAGMVVIVIGLAPVKPAEFVVFRMSQGVANTQVEPQGAMR